MTTSTDMWLPVQVPSQKFKSQYKFQVPGALSKICTEIASKQLENYKFSNQTHHELHSCKETQTEIKSAETIHIWNTESQTINTIIRCSNVDNHNQELLYQSHNMQMYK